MAFNDTLFQLGMDLTRSSPAQKEDFAARAESARAALRKTPGNRAESRDAGRYLSVDIIDARTLDDIEHVEETLRKAFGAAEVRVTMQLRGAEPAGKAKRVANEPAKRGKARVAA